MPHGQPGRGCRGHRLHGRTGGAAARGVVVRPAAAGERLRDRLRRVTPRPRHPGTRLPARGHRATTGGAASRRGSTKARRRCWVRSSRAFRWTPGPRWPGGRTTPHRALPGRRSGCWLPRCRPCARRLSGYESPSKKGTVPCPRRRPARRPITGRWYGLPYGSRASCGGRGDLILNETPCRSPERSSGRGR